jgi:putative flippase GtrA
MEKSEMVKVEPEVAWVRLVRIYRSRQFVLFLLFGGSAAIVNLASGWLFYGPTGGPLPYWAAVTIAAMNGLLVNFTLNYIFNFRYRGRSAVRQLGTFCIVALVGIALTAGLAVTLRKIIGIRPDLNLVLFFVCV